MWRRLLGWCLLEAISVRSVTKAYGTVEALRGVDVAVRPGEIFGLIGPNGAGKTTLIRILVGALRPDGGEVRVLDRDPVTQRSEVRRRIGYMPQEPALYADLSSRANVEFFAAAHVAAGVDELAHGALEFVDLLDRAGDPVHTLSGGMKQRVSLACALAHEPDLLFLDEPTSGIDPILRESFWHGFRRLADAGKTIVLSTHQMNEALACDRVAIIQRGRVVAADAPRSLIGRGRAKVTVWSQGESTEYLLDDYQTELPRILGEGDPVTRVEIERETLDEIVLRLIDDGSDGAA